MSKCCLYCRVDGASTESNRLAIVSPAPPSKSTLSGTTTAALPVAFSRVLMCWRKLSCLLELVVQKSCRL